MQEIELYSESPLQDMVAHVGDFGLAKFVFEESHNPSKKQTMSD
jgi:hypothetical protein